MGWTAKSLGNELKNRGVRHLRWVALEISNIFSPQDPTVGQRPPFSSSIHPDLELLSTSSQNARRIHLAISVWSIEIWGDKVTIIRLVYGKFGHAVWLFFHKSMLYLYYGKIVNTSVFQVCAKTLFGIMRIVACDRNSVLHLAKQLSSEINFKLLIMVFLLIVSEFMDT